MARSKKPTADQARTPLRPPGIADVARLAGVSTATVSRALMTPDRVRAETREAVLAAVAATGYTPNRAARSLRARRTLMVMVIVPNVANPFFAEVLRGIDAALSQAGYGLIIANLDNSRARERHFVELAFARQVDGILLMNGWTPSMGGDRLISEAGLPIVSVGTNNRGAEVPKIIVRNREASQEVAAHLIGLGHTALAYISGPRGNWVNAQRRRGFREGVAAAGLDPSAIAHFAGDFTFQAGIEAARQYLAGDARPTGVYAASDEIAIGFITTIRRAGIRVPEDVSVVGFDGIAFGDYCEPTLTTVEQPRQELGRAGANLLLEMIAAPQAPAPDWIEIDATLVIRDSTGPAPRAKAAADRTVGAPAE